MKKVILIILSLFSFAAYAQTDSLVIPYVNKEIIYQDTVSAKGLTKKQLYANAKQWAVDNYRNYFTTIQSEDIEFEHLSVKGVAKIKTSTIGMGRTFRDRFTIQIDIKDNKYRYKIYDFFVREAVSLYGEKSLNDLYEKVLGNGSAAFSKGQCRDLVLNNGNEVRNIIVSLKKAMSTKDDF